MYLSRQIRMSGEGGQNRGPFFMTPLGGLERREDRGAEDDPDLAQYASDLRRFDGRLIG